MINPTSSEARELIGLAERMGIPTEDAVRSVLQHLTNQELSEDLIVPRVIRQTNERLGRSAADPKPCSSHRLLDDAPEEPRTVAQPIETRVDSAGHLAVLGVGQP